MPPSEIATRIAEEAASLSPEKQTAILDFVLFVKERAARGDAEDGDAAWERILADPKPRPKLEVFLREAAAEGEGPLDLKRL